MHKKYRQFLMALFLFFLFITFLNINENKIYADTSPEIDIILKNGDNDKLTRNEFVDAFEGAFFVIDVYAKSYSGDVTIGVMNVEFLIDNDYFTFASFDDPQIEVPGVNPWDDPSSVNLWNSTGVNPSENEIGITYNALEIKDGKLGLTIDSNETLLFSINVVYHIDFANPGNMPSDLSTIFNLGFNPEKNHKIGESSVNIYNNNNINFKHIQIGEASIDPTADITGIDITGSNSYTNTMSNTTGNSYETENKVTFHHANEGINLNPLFVSPSATITSFKLGEDDLSELISEDCRSIEGLELSNTKTYIMVVKDDDDKEETYTLTINVEDPDDEDGITFTTNQSSANHIGFGEGVDSNNYYIEVPYSVATIEVTGDKTSTSPYTNIDGNNKVSKSNLEVGDNLLGDITVKTEAGTSQVYTVYVTRLEGNSNTDFNVRISTMDDGEYIEIDGDRYDALVPEDKDQYSIDFSGFESTTKIYYSIGIDEDISSSSATLLPSSNRIISQSINKDQTREYTILSVAENEDIFQITYLYVKRAASSLAEIDEIKITENPNYNAVVVTNVGGVYRYELKDENSTTLFVNISLLEGATLEFLKDGSNVSNTISVGDLVTGNNEYTIKVIPANLDPEKIVNYTLNIVKRSSEKEVTGIKLVDDSYTEIANGIGEGEGKFIKDGDTYRISVPYEAGNTFRVTITSSLKSIIKIGSSANNDNEDTWQVTLSGITSQTEFTYFTIRDEYGAISDQFTISITRLAADDNANLSNITIDGSNLPSFNPGTLDYKNKVYIGRSEDGSQTVHVLGELESDKSIVKYFVGSNEYINGQITIVNGQNTPVDIEVTAQSGRKQTYKITIVAGETNNSINNIILPGINFTFDKEQLVYNLSAPYSVESVTPSVTRGGTYSTVVGATKHALTVGVEESFTIYAVSEVGVKGVEYTFNITRADANTFNDLESLQISYNGGSPDALLIENGPTYNIYKTPVINSVTVVATITGHQGETIDGVEGNTQTINRVLSHGLNVIEITVLNEKKIAQVYKINITIADDNNEFSKLRIGNNDYYMDDFDELNTLVLDDVLYSVNELPITVTNSSNFSTTTFSGKYLPSEGIWQLDKFGNELNVITFTITSEDGQNVKTYTVKVKRLEANKIALLDNLEILLNGSNLLDDITNYTLNETKNINLRVDRGSNLVTIKAYVKPEDRSKLTELGDGVLIDGLYVYTYQLTLSDGLTSFKSFKITSEDGFTVNTFNVNILSKNNDNEVNSLKIYNGSILLYDGNFDDLILDETIPFSVNSLRFVVTKNDRYSRILLDNAKEGSEGQYEVTFNALVTTGENNTIKLRVESEIIETEATNYNSTFKSKEITITYTKNTPSDTAELDNLEVIVDGINILDGFNKDTTSYKKLLVSRDFDNVNITATPGANGSILAGSDIGVKNLNKNGVRTFTITVLAEDGISQKEYTVEIFNQNDDPSVLEITIDGEVITVEEDEFNYELEHKLPYTKTSVDVLVNTKDEFAIVTIQGQNKLSYGKNTIKVIVKGEYTHSTLTNEYFIIVTVLEPETNINLIDLSVETTDGINLPFDSGLYDPINNQYNFIITLEDSLSNPFINILYNKEVYQTLTKPDGLGFSNLEIKEIAGEINETITFFVNAEDDASQKYTITIIKNIILSDDFSIKSVSLKDNDNLSYINEFNEGTLEYDAHVLFRYKTLSLIITPNHEKANVIITGNLNNLNIGLNEVTFYVKAEDGTQGPLYKININRGEASDDTYLKEIYIADPLNGSNYLIGLEERTPLEVFNKEKPNYTINLDQSYVGKNIVVRYLLNFSEQTTERTNNNSIKSLVYGENFFDIAVYAEDKDEVDPRIYKVTIYVKYKENELKTLKVNNESVDFEDLYYETEELEANIDLSLLNPGTYKLYDSENNLITNIIDLELGDNIVTIEIYNDYGELVDTKELTIKRLESSDNSILSATLKDKDNNDHLNFNESTYLYNVVVEEAITKLNLNILLNNDFAEVVGTTLGNHDLPLDIEYTITFIVKAENGDETNTYTINILRKSLSKDVTLEEISISVPENDDEYLLGLEGRIPNTLFDSNTFEYVIELDESYDGLNMLVKYKTNHPNQLISGVSYNDVLELVYGLNSLSIMVRAEDPEVIPKVYKINIYVKYKENELKTLKVNNDSIDFNELYYETEDLEANIDLSLLNPGLYELYDSEDNLITNIIDLELGDNIVTIKIYNDYGELVDTKELTIKRLESSDNSILSATLKDKDNNDHLNFNESTYLYNVEVEEAITKLNLGILLNNDFAEVVGTTLGNHDLPLDIKYVITFTVKAENGDETNTYTINILRKSLSKDVTLEEISISIPDKGGEYLLGLEGRFPNTLFDSNTFEYTIELDESYEGFNINVRFIKNHPNQTTERTGYNSLIELNYGRNYFDIVVYAEDKSETPSSYKVEIFVKYKDNELNSLKVNNEGVSLDNLYYETEDLEANIDLSLLNPGTYKLYDSEDNLITNILDLELGDNTLTIEIYNDYGVLVDTKVLTIKRLESSLKDITKVELIGNDNKNHLTNFNKETYKYEINVDHTINSVELIIEASDKTIIYGEGIYQLTPNIPVIITFYVEAENGDLSKEYEITITSVAPSEDTYLEEIYFRDPLNNDLYLFGLESRNPLYVYDQNQPTHVIDLDYMYENRDINLRIIKGNDGQILVENTLNVLITLAYGRNEFNVAVFAEDPEVEPFKYTIIINVKHMDNELDLLKVNGDLIDLNNLYYETEELKTTIVPQLLNEGSYKMYDKDSNLITDNLDLDLGDNVVTIEIYNDYGDLLETKELTIKRLESSDDSILSATLKDNYGKDYLSFDKEKDTYNIKVTSDIDELTLLVNPNNAFAEILGSDLGSHLLPLDNEITLTFRVKAEDGSLGTLYTINILRESLSTDTSLKEIYFRDPINSSSWLFGLETRTPEPINIYNKDNLTHTIILGKEYINRSLLVQFSKNHNNQTVTPIDLGVGNTFKLSHGRNEFSFVVTAEDEDVEPSIYVIIIDVLYLENDLTNLKINNDNIVLDNNDITYHTELLEALISFETNNLFGRVDIIKDGNKVTNLLDLDYGDNELILEVYNENDELVKVYNLNIIRDESSDKNINDVTLKDNKNKNYLTFDEDVLNYDITVPYEIDKLTLDIITSNEFSQSFGDGLYELTPGLEKKIVFYVNAENGDLGKEYTINVLREFNSDNELGGLTVSTNILDLLNNDDFDPLVTTYSYELNEEHLNVSFSYISKPGQTIIGLGFDIDELSGLEHGINVFEILVSPEDPEEVPTIYAIIIEVINSNADLSELLVDDLDILLENEFNYDLGSVSSDISSINIEAILKDEFASFEIKDGLGNVVNNNIINLNPGVNVITITTLSEDKENTNTYTITIEQLLETNDLLDEINIKTNLDSYLLGGSDKNPETIFIDNTFNYSFIVDEKVTTLDISYILGSSKQSVLGDLGTLNVLHGINTYEITVYPEDPELDGNTYVIVVEQIYSEIDLLELLVDGNNIYEEGLNTYTLDDVTTKVTSINILPILTNSYGSYLIKDHNNDNVLGNDVNLKFGNNEIKVILKSEDESMTKTITIKIKQVLDGKTDIDGLEVIDLKNNTNKIIYDEDITLYQVELNNSSDTVRVKVDADNSIKVYIQLEESSPQLRLNARAEFNLSAGKNTVVTVFTEAEDGSLSEVIYIDLYRRLDGEAALSDNNNLIDIVLEIPIDKVGINFNPDILEYVVKVPYSSEEIYIKGYPESKNATVHGEGAYSLSVGLNDPIYIRVQAEDGTPSNKQYKIILDREIPNTDVTLRDLYVTDLDGNLLPFDQGEFDKNNGFYSISLGEGSGINKVKIYAEKSVLSQEIYNIGERDLLGEEEGKYNTVLTVTVVAEDGSSGEYIIYVLHDLDFSSIKEVKDISIIGDDGVSYFGIEFLSDQYDYEVFVPFTVSETRLIVQSIGNVIYLDNNNNEIPDNRIQEFGFDNLNVYRFKIRSTNELNESEVYEINVIRKEADDNNLLETILIDGIEINNFDPLTNEYTYIQYIVDKDNLDILAKSQSEQSLVNGNGNYKLTKGESIFVSIVVTAENKTTNTYTLEIKYVNSNALLGELSVYELDALMGEFEIPVELVVGEFEYTVVIGKNVEYVNIKGSAEDQGGARLTGFGRYRVGDTDLTVPITVISGDLLEERTYLVTITKNMVSDARLYEIRLNNKLLDDFDPHEFSYESFFKNGDGNIVTISARTHDPNAVIRFNDKIYDNNTFTINDLAPGQTSVRISVTSEDNQVTYVYTIDLVKESQPDLLLTILLILSFLLWIITLLIIIIRKNKKQKIDKDQLIF